LGHLTTLQFIVILVGVIDELDQLQASIFNVLAVGKTDKDTPPPEAGAYPVFPLNVVLGFQTIASVVNIPVAVAVIVVAQERLPIEPGLIVVCPEAIVCVPETEVYAIMFQIKEPLYFNVIEE
jgi:hypothetical protein